MGLILTLVAVAAIVILFIVVVVWYRRYGTHVVCLCQHYNVIVSETTTSHMECHHMRVYIFSICRRYNRLQVRYEHLQEGPLPMTMAQTEVKQDLGYKDGYKELIEDDNQ